MANINAEPANIDLVSLQTKRYSTFLDEKATAPPRAENGARANEAARGSAPSAESGIRDEKREEIKNGFTDRLTGILGKLIDKQAEMGGDFDGLFQPASKQPIKRLFDNLTADAGSGRAIDADKLAAFMADDRGLAAVYEVLQLESSDLKTASEGIEMPGGRVRWLEAVYGVDPKLFKKVRGKDGMLQVPEKNRAAIGDKARLGELDGFLDKFRDANGIPVKEDFALRLLRSLNSGGPIYLGFNDSGYEKKVFEELSSRNLAKNINGFELVNTYQEVQAKLLAGEVNGIFKDIIKNKRSDELATLFARRREELRTGPEGKWVIEGLEEQKADIQRGIAPVKRFAAEMEESVDKSLSVTERTERRSELQGEQKELLDSVLIDGQTVSYDQALNDLQDILDAAGNPERLQKLLNRNVTIGGEDVITTRSVPVEPVVPAASVVEATVPAPTGVETSTTPERGVDLGIDYAKKWAAETEIKVKESEAEAASPEYENLTKKAKAKRHAVLAERRREGRVAAARLEELSSQTKTDITAEDALASEIAYAKKWAAETEIKVKESEAEAASPEYKDLKPNVKAIRHAVLAERRRQRDAAATRMEELRAEVSTNAAPVVAAVESTTPAPAPVVVTQPEAVVEPQTRTEIVVNSELVRERIKELIENRADLDLLEQSASGELDMDSVREQMSEMQEARREISSFNVTDLDMGGGHLLSIPFGTLELQTLTYEQLMVRINKVHQATTIAAQIGVDIPILGWPETENGDPEKIKMLLLAQVDAQVDAQFGPPSDDLENALAVGVINLRLKNIQTEIEGFLTGREEQILAIDARIRQIKENGLPSAELDMIEGIINSEKYNEIRSYFEDLPLDQEGEGLVTPEGLPGSLEQFLEEGNVYKNILELFDPATPEAISQEMIWQALRDHFNLWIKTYPPDPSGKPATWAAPVNRRVDTWDEAMFALRDGMGLGKLPDGNRSTVRISMEGLGEFFSEVMFKILEGRIGIAKPD